MSRNMWINIQIVPDLVSMELDVLLAKNHIVQIPDRLDMVV